MNVKRYINNEQELVWTIEWNVYIQKWVLTTLVVVWTVWNAVALSWVFHLLRAMLIMNDSTANDYSRWNTLPSTPVIMPFNNHCVDRTTATSFTFMYLCWSQPCHRWTMLFNAMSKLMIDCWWTLGFCNLCWSQPCHPFNDDVERYEQVDDCWWKRLSGM